MESGGTVQGAVVFCREILNIICLTCSCFVTYIVAQINVL